MFLPFPLLFSSPKCICKVSWMESRWDQNTDTRCNWLTLPYRIYILNIPLYIKCTCKWIFISLTSTIQRVQSALPASVGKNKEYTAGSDWPQKSSIQCYTKVIDMFKVWRCRIVTNDIFIVKRKRKKHEYTFSRFNWRVLLFRRVFNIWMWAKPLQ